MQHWQGKLRAAEKAAANSSCLLLSRPSRLGSGCHEVGHEWSESKASEAASRVKQRHAEAG